MDKVMKDRMIFEELYEVYKSSSDTVEVIGGIKYIKTINKCKCMVLILIVLRNAKGYMFGNLWGDEDDEFKMEEEEQINVDVFLENQSENDYLEIEIVEI